MNQSNDPAGEIRVGVSLIIQRGNTVLMGMRKGSHEAGKYSFPGGHLDYGETVEMACMRELSEEAGPALVVQNYAEVSYTQTLHPEIGRQYFTFYATCEYVSGEAELMEPEKCAGWAWHPVGNLPEPLFGNMAALVAAGDQPHGVIWSRLRGDE